MIFDFRDETSQKKLYEWVKNKKNSGKLVFTNGCFDILHTGHVRYLKEASNSGDFLIIGVNSDSSVKENKGENRPINGEFERSEILNALGFVDATVIFDELTPLKLIEFIIPDVLAKGDEYKKDQIVGATFVEENGGEVFRIKMVEGYSTTSIINKMDQPINGKKNFKKIVAVIPSRYDSTRLPGKPLKKIGSKTLINHVYDGCKKSKFLNEIIVATDDERIFEEVEKFNGKVLMTSKSCRTGTDRIMEVAIKTQGDIFLNIQGDEPLIKGELIDSLIEFFNKNDFDIVTAASLIEDKKEYEDPNSVKVVFDKNGRALYFSRSSIPYYRDTKFKNGFKHIGIYLYKRKELIDFARMDKSNLEICENLEQLRAMENGISIGVLKCDYNPIGVDTMEDLERVRKLMEEK